jgi:hypothetical protein
MSLLATLGAGFFAKIVGVLGDSFLKPILQHYQNKDTQFGKIMVSALDAQAATNVANADARVRMLGTRWGAFLLVLIVAPPATYMGSVYGVTLLETFTGLRLEVIALPARFEAYAVDIIQVFIGGGSVVAAANVAARQWFKR